MLSFVKANTEDFEHDLRPLSLAIQAITMAPYNFDFAKKVLSDTEKDRFLCCYLNSTDMNAVSNSGGCIAKIESR